MVSSRELITDNVRYKIRCGHNKKPLNDNSVGFYCIFGPMEGELRIQQLTGTSIMLDRHAGNAYSWLC